MSINYCFTFSAIELTVRYCDNQADDLDIIGCYVHLGLKQAKNLESLTHVRTAHMRVINTLIDTMCDNTLPVIWRRHCHLYVKRLLPLLFEMLSPSEYKQKTDEINTLYSYFLCQPIANKPQTNIQPTITKKQFNQ